MVLTWLIKIFNYINSNDQNIYDPEDFEFDLESQTYIHKINYIVINIDNLE